MMNSIEIVKSATRLDVVLSARTDGRAIYPGFTPHTGEIAGEWIEGEARFGNPRLM